MAKAPRITAALLKRKKVCASAYSHFNAIFPKGTPITYKNARKARRAGIYVKEAVDYLATKQRSEAFYKEVNYRTHYWTIVGAVDDLRVCKALGGKLTKKQEAFLKTAHEILTKLYEECEAL